MKKILGIALVVIMILIAIGGYYYPQFRLGASPGPDHYDPQGFYGGFLKGSAIATSSTDTTTTIPVSWLKDVDFVAFTPNLSATTLTLPASSTVPQFLPKAGNMQEVCIYNATSTAAATLSIVAATGIDLQMASTTSLGSSGATGGVIPAGGTGCIRFVRLPLTASAFDIVADFTLFTNAD